MDGEREGEPPIIVKVRITTAQRELYDDMGKVDPRRRAERLRHLSVQGMHMTTLVTEAIRHSARVTPSSPEPAQQKQEPSGGADNYLDRIRI